MKELTQKQREVYEVMVNARNGNSYSMGTQFIVGRTGVSQGNVSSIIRALIKHGYITMTHNGRCGRDGCSRYRLNALGNTNTPQQSVFQQMTAETSKGIAMPIPDTPATHIDIVATNLANATTEFIKKLYEQQQTIDELTMKLSQVKEDAMIKLQREMKELTDRVQAW